MRKIIRRTIYLLSVVALLAAGTWFVLKPGVEGSLAGALRAFGFTQPVVALSPRVNGQLTFIVQEGEAQVLSALIDLPASTGQTLEIPVLVLTGENWPHSGATTPTPRDSAALVWQLVQKALPVAQMEGKLWGYRRLHVPAVTATLSPTLSLTGALTAERAESDGSWAVHLTGTLTAFSATTPFEISAALAAAGTYQLHASLSAFSPVLPAGKVDGLDFSFDLNGGVTEPVVSADLSARSAFGLSQIELSLNNAHKAGGQWPLDFGATYAGQVFALTGVVDGPAFTATLTPPTTLKFGNVSVTGLKGAVKLDPLYPPVVPAGQVLEASALEAGVPLMAVRVVFGYRDQRLALSEAWALLFGGTVQLEPVILSLPLRDTKCVANVKDMDLAQALLMANVDGLAGTGRLSGRVPFVYSNRQLSFEDTSLSSGEDGVITYQPQTPPSFVAEGGQGQLLGQVFRNFHYNGLKLGLGGKLGDNLTLSARLEGRNPEFYNGHPVAFTLNLSGALESVLKNGLANFQFSREALHDMMQLDKGALSP